MSMKTHFIDILFPPVTLFMPILGMLIPLQGIRRDYDWQTCTPARTDEGSRLQPGFDTAAGVDLHQLGRIQETIVQGVEGLCAGQVGGKAAGGLKPG